MAQMEPMDVDYIGSDLDDKENSVHNANVVPRTPCTEKGYEELDVSELNMKLRYSITPASSPMSRSYTANSRDSKISDFNDDSLNKTMVNDNTFTRSLNSTITKSDSVLKSPKLPLQTLPPEQYIDNNGKRLLDMEGNNVTITVNENDNIDENLSLPSTSSSLVQTPEATTPTKEIPKIDGGSPIMRGLKSVLNMFRPSQSPIPLEDTVIQQEHSPVETHANSEELSNILALSSTPLGATKTKDVNVSRHNSPLKESLVFSDDLERELQWKDETTIIFKDEKIPIHKLLFQQQSVNKLTENIKNKENFNSSVEYMDVSYNDSVVADKTVTDIETTVKKDCKEADAIESDGEFVDCEAPVTRGESHISKHEIEKNNKDNVVMLSDDSSDPKEKIVVKSECDSIILASTCEDEHEQFNENKEQNKTVSGDDSIKSLITHENVETLQPFTVEDYSKLNCHQIDFGHSSTEIKDLENDTNHILGAPNNTILNLSHLESCSQEISKIDAEKSLQETANDNKKDDDKNTINLSLTCNNIKLDQINMPQSCYETDKSYQDLLNDKPNITMPLNQNNLDNSHVISNTKISEITLESNITGIVEQNMEIIQDNPIEQGTLNIQPTSENFTDIVLRGEIESDSSKFNSTFDKVSDDSLHNLHEIKYNIIQTSEQSQSIVNLNEKNIISESQTDINEKIVIESLQNDIISENIEFNNKVDSTLLNEDTVTKITNDLPSNVPLPSDDDIEKDSLINCLTKQGNVDLNFKNDSNSFNSSDSHETNHVVINNKEINISPSFEDISQIAAVPQILSKSYEIKLETNDNIQDMSICEDNVPKSIESVCAEPLKTAPDVIRDSEKEIKDMPQIVNEPQALETCDINLEPSNNVQDYISISEDNVHKRKSMEVECAEPQKITEDVTKDYEKEFKEISQIVIEPQTLKTCDFKLEPEIEDMSICEDNFEKDNSLADVNIDSKQTTENEVKIADMKHLCSDRELNNLYSEKDKADDIQIKSLDDIKGSSAGSINTDKVEKHDIFSNKEETIEEEIITSENNSPFVSVTDINLKSDEGDVSLEGIENPFESKSRIADSPPLSPQCVSKGYNINFDEIDDPFATKTNIRLSPTPDTPTKISNNSISNCKQTNEIAKKKVQYSHRRKSQPMPKNTTAKKQSFNATFDGVVKEKNNLEENKEKSNIPENEDLTKKQFTDIGLDNMKVRLSTEGKDPHPQKIADESLNDPPYFKISSNPQNAEFNENVLQNTRLLDFAGKAKETSPKREDDKDMKDNDNSNLKNDNFHDQSSKCPDEENLFSKTIKNEKRNTFNIPEIDDKNFNPFATKSKICQCPTPGIENDDISITSINNKVQMSETQISNISNISSSSKNTEERNDTVREVNTEDEDTAEAPILEADDFIDVVKVSDFCTEKDMMGFDNLPQQASDDNADNGELFIDAEAFEFLLNQNKSNVVADSGKESLFLKFDPLFAKRVSSDGVLAALKAVHNRQSTPRKPCQTPSKSREDDEKPTASSSNSEILPEENSEEGFVAGMSKPMMVVNPAINSFISPRKSTPPKINRQSLTFTSPAMAVIDRLLNLSGGNTTLLDHETSIPQVSREYSQTDIALTQLREHLAEKEIQVHNLRSESKELKDRLSKLELQVRGLETESEERLKKVNTLNDRLVEKTKINKSMAVVVEEYERTIASLISEMDQEKKRNAEERMKLMSERDEQTAHLSSMESSFSDLHSKYEKSKQIIFSMKANEDTYKKAIKEFEDNLAKMQNNYELLKQHATSKLNHANQELEKFNKAHEAEVLKLNAMIKRKELHITSLEESLAQKTKANEELTAICDELINKVG